MEIINLRFVDKTPTPEFDAYVAVDVDKQDVAKLKAELEDSLTSYMENAFDYNTKEPFKQAVTEVMNACGHKWIPVDVTTITI